MSREAQAQSRQIVVAHESQQVPVRGLHRIADDGNRLCPERGLVRLRDSGHLLERRIEEALLGGGVGDGGDRGVAPLHGHLGRRESALQPAPHLLDLFAEVARDVAHLPDPIAVVLRVAVGPASRVAQIRPERRIRIRGHLVVAEFLVRDQRLDLRAVDVVVHALPRGELRALDRVELGERVLPHLQARLLRIGIDLRKMILDGLLRVLVVGKLFLAPLPFGRVDGREALVRRLLLRARRECHERCRQRDGDDEESAHARWSMIGHLTLPGAPAATGARRGPRCPRTPCHQPCATAATFASFASS